MADENKQRIWAPVLLIIAGAWFFIDALFWSGGERWDRLAAGAFIILLGVGLLRKAMPGDFIWSDTGQDGGDDWDADGD